MIDKNNGFRTEAAAAALFLIVSITAASLIEGGSLSPFGGGMVGKAGKFISETLSFFLGISSFLIPAGLFYLCIRLLFFKPSKNEFAADIAALTGLTISSALLSALLFEGVIVNHLTGNGAGGKLGASILSFTEDSVGKLGSYLTGFSVAAVCCVFLARTSFRSVLSAVFTAAAQIFKIAGFLLLKITRLIFFKSASAGRKLFYLAVQAARNYRQKKKNAVQTKPVKTAPSPQTQQNLPDKTPKIVVKNEEPKHGELTIVKKDSENKETGKRLFTPPPIDLLEPSQNGKAADIDKDEAYKNARLIEEKLSSFGVSGKVTEIKPGPVITMFEYKPDPGVRVSRISALENDLAMNLRATSIRIISPIPGRDVVGIEVPNSTRQKVCLREIIENDKFKQGGSLLKIAVGKDIFGTPYYTDLATAPHLMIAGTTGSGKSVLLNSLLASLFYKAGPERLRLLMIDPKMLEFSIYEDIPHLLHPIVTEPRKAIAALKWSVAEMENRYKILSEKGVRSIDSYNRKIETEEGEDSAKILPYIVILIDELADLIMSAAGDTRDAIIRIAQKARAAGIHLVVATQRPSADVVSGLLKANIPARISFLVSSKVDSRIVLDTQGAESLLGKGDMLYLKPGTNALERIQGALITDGEREKIVNFLKSRQSPVFDEQVLEAINKTEETEQTDGQDEQTDEMYDQALEVVRDAGQVSISMLQRRLKIGYNRAATIVEKMERDGIVGEHKGAGQPREVILPDGK